ncbi:MAG: endolytic transglycosylase MltG [Erysipelotrichaceae bacterium]|nr:endolytic transglycosylase MltG [Erysipelotrichaceae bacterium]
MAKRKRRKLKLGRILVIILVLLLGAAGLMYRSYQKALKPVSSESQNVLFTVSAGENAKKVCENLEAAELINDSGWSYVYVRQNKLSDVKAGEYLLDPSWDTDQIFKTLNDPLAAIVDEGVVTIIEGDWIKHIASKIASETEVKEEDLLNLWNDEKYIRSLMDRYPFLSEDMFDKDVRYLLEGYLAPNTYRFFRDTTAEEVTEKILDETLRVYNEFAADMKKSKLSVHELYTLASIVQYESGLPEDMKKIAGVFYNRMDADMPLQSSVTVCYAIDLESSENWQACEMNPTFDSPYNTYKYSGLPPGPIENPGREALDAVLHPAKHKYYFFMAEVYGDGTVHYAETLEEHEKNVEKYLK